MYTENPARLDSWIRRKSPPRSGGLWHARLTSPTNSLLDDDVDLFSDGILDSLMVVSLVSFCEEKFGFELDGQEFLEEDLRTIAGLATLIDGRGNDGRRIVGRKSESH